MTQIDQRQMLPTGAVLDDRYRIVKYLASGGFGNTYVAEDMHFGVQVALKEFFMRGTNHRSADGTTVEVSNDTNTPVFIAQLKKFRREARRIFELRNDHIIHVFDLFDANDTSYYVMDLVKGTSLSEQTRQHPLTEPEVRDIAIQVLDALKTMHDAGLYHLDVKPGNIMRDANGHCTLIDFGASKQLSADERNTLSSSTMAYTPGYAPLEQIAQQNKNIGPWTDFFALGATLYKLLTGDSPPEVDSEDITPDGRQFPYSTKVSTNMRHVISTLMNPSRRLRPQNAAVVKTLLDGLVDETVSEAISTSISSEEQTQKTTATNNVLKTPDSDSTNYSMGMIGIGESNHPPLKKGSDSVSASIQANNPDEKTLFTNKAELTSPASESTSSPMDEGMQDNDYIEEEYGKKQRKLWYIMGAAAILLVIFGYIMLTKGSGENYLAKESLNNMENSINNYPSGTVETPAQDESTEPVIPRQHIQNSYLKCPDKRHPHAINLGLPSGTLWACCNVDATTPEGYGGYYAWGETEEKSVYNWKTYKHCDRSKETCHNLGNTISGTQYDVAHVKWGEPWQMPTVDQIEELINNCDSKWTFVKGISGIRFTSKYNGSSIFLPASSRCQDEHLYVQGYYGYYWSGSKNHEVANEACNLFFYSGNLCWDCRDCSDGNTIRPITY